METRWIAARSGTSDEIFESLKRGIPSSDPTAVAQHKFRLRIEPGIRTGSTEVYLEEKNLPLGVPVKSEGVKWTGVSDNLDLEGTVLTSLAYYLGEHLNTSQAFSMLASNIGGQRAELIPDRMKPVLKYKLPFDRAWATVGDALESARINVEDLNRDEANYYVYYDDGEKREPGFFGRLFSGDEQKTAPGMANRYLVHLDSKNDEVQVTILKDSSTLAEASIAEKLLTIIKEYST
jgi:outer membrane protein assembly factor BamC